MKVNRFSAILIPDRGAAKQTQRFANAVHARAMGKTEARCMFHDRNINTIELIVLEFKTALPGMSQLLTRGTR